MPRISTIMACLLALAAPAAMAQGIAGVPGDGRQQAIAPTAGERSKPIFIHDEFGNVYDSRGELITPRPVKLKR